MKSPAFELILGDVPRLRWGHTTLSVGYYKVIYTHLLALTLAGGFYWLWYSDISTYYYALIGPVELDVNTLQRDARRRVVIVDLGSVDKTEDGDPVYWLEKAEVMQRNQWELIIAVEFSSGLAGHVTSRPFRVTTKSGSKMRRNGGL